MEGLLILFLLIQQISIVLPNPSDDLFLGDTPVLKCLNMHQGLKKGTVVSLKKKKREMKLTREMGLPR